MNVGELSWATFTSGFVFSILLLPDVSCLANDLQMVTLSIYNLSCTSLEGSEVADLALKDSCLASQGCTLHIAAARAEDHCMVFAELSRLFFLGQSNQQFANFLHLITLMASLGSSEIDVESYIVDTQGVQPLPLEVTPWIVNTSIKDSSPVNLGSSAETDPFLADLYLQRHAKLEESISKKAKPMQKYSGWPPRSWVPLPTVKSTAMTSVKVNDRSGFSEAGSFRDQDTAESPQQGAQAANVSERIWTGLSSNSSHRQVTDLRKSDSTPGFSSLQASSFETTNMTPAHEVVLPNMGAVHGGGGETFDALVSLQQTPFLLLM